VTLLHIIKPNPVHYIRGLTCDDAVSIRTSKFTSSIKVTLVQGRRIRSWYFDSDAWNKGCDRYMDCQMALFHYKFLISAHTGCRIDVGVSAEVQRYWRCIDPDMQELFESFSAAKLASFGANCRKAMLRLKTVEMRQSHKHIKS